MDFPISLRNAHLSACGSLYAPALVSAQDAMRPVHPAPNYRAFCIAVLELRGNATPELLQAIAVRYALLVECPETGALVENPSL